MASITELKNRIKILISFAKVVNIQKIVVMKDIAEIKGQISYLRDTHSLVFKVLSDIRKHNSSIIDRGLLPTGPSKNKQKKSKNIYKEVIFLMETKPIDKYAQYSLKKMVQYSKDIDTDETLIIAVGDELKRELKKAGIRIYKSFNNKIAFSNLLFNEVSSLTHTLYESLISGKILFMFDDVNSPSKLKEIQLVPFSHDLGASEIDKSAIKMDKNNYFNEILSSINFKKTSFPENIINTLDFLTNMQLANLIKIAFLSYQLNIKNRELYSLDDKEKNILKEEEVAKLLMQRVRKEKVTNELITTSGAFLNLNKKKKGDEDD